VASPQLAQQANLGEQMHPAEIHKGEVTTVIKVQVQVAVVWPDAKRNAPGFQQRLATHERQLKQEPDQA